MFSGGDYGLVTLPSAYFQRISDQGAVVDQFEAGEVLGRRLKRGEIDGLFQNGVAAVDQAVTQVPIDLDRCATSLTQSFETIFQVRADGLSLDQRNFRPALTRQMLGAARFCLNGSQIPTVQKVWLKRKLDSFDRGDQVLAKAELGAGQVVGALLEDADRTLFDFPHYPQAVLTDDAFSEEKRTSFHEQVVRLLMGDSNTPSPLQIFVGAGDVFGFELAAYVAMNHAEKIEDRDLWTQLRSNLGILRNDVYVEALKRIVAEGVEAVQKGNTTGEEIAREGLNELWRLAHQFYSSGSEILAYYRREIEKGFEQMSLARKPMADPIKVADLR